LVSRLSFFKGLLGKEREAVFFDFLAIIFLHYIINNQAKRTQTKGKPSLSTHNFSAEKFAHSQAVAFREAQSGLPFV
jgi:hypothetical protein